MSRRRRVHKKEERLDSHYASPVVAQLISTVMISGKKSLAERIVYGALERQVSLAMRWLVGYASARRGVGLTDALANEIRDAANGQGNAIKKRDDTHRMAQANRAFAHFRY